MPTCARFSKQATSSTTPDAEGARQCRNPAKCLISRCSRKLIACLSWFCSRTVGGDGVGLVLCEGDEAGLNRGDLAGQLGRVCGLEQRGQFDGRYVGLCGLQAKQYS